MKSFSYHKPKNLREAFDLLRKYGEKAAVLAGGTDLLVELKKRLKSPTQLIDIKGLSSLEGIRLDPEGFLRIGPLTPLEELSHSPLLKNGWGLLAQATSKVGSLQIRNRGTLGGNICHASPSGDTLPALLCLAAKLKLAGKESERVIPLEDFFLGPGKSALGVDELLTEVILPLPPLGCRGVYKKFALRRAMDLAVVGVAVLGSMDPQKGVFADLRIGLGAVAPTPIRARKAEALLKEARVSKEVICKAGKLTQDEAAPISDLRGSEWYRREMIGHLTREALWEIAALA